MTEAMACDCTCHDDINEAVACEGGCHEFYHRRPLGEVKAIRAHLTLLDSGTAPIYSDVGCGDPYCPRCYVGDPAARMMAEAWFYAPRDMPLDDQEAGGDD